MARQKKEKGVSLVKGPVAIIGLAALALGVTGLIFGGQSFSIDAPSGTVEGEKWLGLELNGWSNLLFIAAGALLTFGAPLHWAAKSMSTIVGLALGAASVIAIVDGDDVFGIFAANGLTELVWGAGAVALLVLALLPRVGGKEVEPDHRHEPVQARRRVQAEPQREVDSRLDGDTQYDGDPRIDDDARLDGTRSPSHADVREGGGAVAEGERGDTRGSTRRD